MADIGFVVILCLFVPVVIYSLDSVGDIKLQNKPFWFNGSS